MSLFEITETELKPIKLTKFSSEGLRERDDIQRLLRDQIEIISPDTLVIAEEFGDWEESRRRIDLLGIDKNANLVVIELKRTEDGGHMELQAIRYAAMIANLTFSKACSIYKNFLSVQGSSKNSESDLLAFLGWSQANEEDFAREVKIVLASANFSKEITSTVLWLNDIGLDISCVRCQPYRDGERVLLDVQTIIPLPEAEEYQMQVRQKQNNKRSSRIQSRDSRKFDLVIGGEQYVKLTKGRLAFHILGHLLSTGITMMEIAEASNKAVGGLFSAFDGKLSEKEFAQKLTEKHSPTKIGRRFCKESELVYSGDETIAITNRWGPHTEIDIDIWQKKFPEITFEYRETGTL
jgi:hypothetical protein